MKKTSIEERLRRSVSNVTPPPLSDSVQDALSKTAPAQKPTAKPTRSVLPRRVLAIAAVLAVSVLLGAVVRCVLTPSAPPVTVASTVISLDVNPSLSIDVDDSESVLAVIPLNDDGVRLVSDTDFRGMSIDAAVDTLVAAMLRDGYLNDVANSVLVTINHENSEYSHRLQQRLSEDITARFAADRFDGAILTQHLDKRDELVPLAEKKHISIGKAKLIQSILAADPLKNFDELAALSIHELHFVASRACVTSVSQTGKASDKAYIGKDRAAELALAHLSLTADDVANVEAELDYEHGTMCYEVEFRTATADYDVLLNAVTGAVLETESEPFNVEDDKDDDRDDEDDDDDDDDDGVHVSVTARPSESTAATTGRTMATTAVLPTTTPATTVGTTAQTTVIPTTAVQTTTAQTTVGTHPTSTTAASQTLISASQARHIALTHAGVSTDTRAEVERGRRNGQPIYEVEFDIGRTEYTYVIDAVTGEVLSHRTDTDD